MSKINVVVEDYSGPSIEPTPTPTPQETDSTEPTDEHLSVPDTGGYGVQNSNSTSSFVPGILCVVAIVSVFIFIMFRKAIFQIVKNILNKDNKEFHIQPSRTSIIVSGVALVLTVVATSFFIRLGSGSANVMAGEALPISVSGDVEIVARPNDDNTFAVGQHTVEVLARAKYGYTLYAYPSSTNLLLNGDETSAIVGLESSDDTAVLSNNNWGVSTIHPSGADSQVWWSMASTQNKPFVVKVTASPDDNLTPIYYGVNIAKDLPRGTYSGSVDYVAIANASSDDSSESSPIDFPDPSTNPIGSDDGQEDESGATSSETPTYSLNFSANQGTKAPTRQSCTATADTGCQIIVQSSNPTRSGYAFLGWAESASATSPQYQSGDSINLTANKTIYAVWERRVNISVAIANGGGSVSGAASGVPAGSDHTITFSPNAGYVIEYVTVNDVVATITNNTLNLTVGDEDVAIVVSYKAIQEDPVEPSTSTVRLSFNANKGSGAPNSTQCTLEEASENCTIQIPNTTPTRDGYQFLGWAMTASATSPAKRPGDSISLSSDTQLYAIWAPKYELKLNNNSGDSTSTSVAECYPTTTQGNCSLTIPSTVPTRKNYSFLGWATSSDATAASLQPGSSLTINKNTTLYAVWQNQTVAVHFINLGNTNGNATLLENKGSYALVDTGPSSSYDKVSDYLDSLNITKLDFVILSHPHGDHHGGAIKLLNDYEIGTIYEKTYTNKDLNADSGIKARYDDITSTAKAKKVPIVYVDKDARFVEASGKSGSVYLNGSMRIHFFNTLQRIDHTQQNGETFDYFSSSYWAGKTENLNSIVNLIRVNNHNVLLTGDLNNYNILNYIMTKKVDVAYKNGQTLDVYSIPHHANYNCTGNKALGITASYLLATQPVDGKFSNGSYRITNDTVLSSNGTTYNSCFKQMAKNYRSAYYSANDKADSKATVFDLTGSNVEVSGGYKGWQLSSRGPND